MMTIRVAFVLMILIVSHVSLCAQETREISLDKIHKENLFGSKGISGMKAMKDGEHYTIMENGTIYVCEYETGRRTDSLYCPDWYDEKWSFIYQYQLSPDESKVLLAVDAEQVYRRSWEADYYIWDIETREIKRITYMDKVRDVSFSPDGKKLAFCFANNLYYRNLETNKLTKITDDGEDDAIINGTTDWVYEEEFEQTRAYQWSSDSKSIAFIKFDESQVPYYVLKYFYSLYPSLHVYKYPKAGEVNSQVSLHVYKLEEDESKGVDIDPGAEYMPRLYATGEDAGFFVYTMNRLQNELNIYALDANSLKKELVYQEKNEKYIEVNNSVLDFTEDGEHFIISSEKDGYKQLYLYNMEGEEIAQITSGEYDITAYYGVDDDEVYFQAAGQSPLQREIYRSDIDGDEAEALSLNKSGWNEATFSADYSYITHVWSDANTPPQISLCDEDGNVLRILEDNSQLKETTKEYGYTKREFFSFPTTDGTELNGWMIKPPGMDESKPHPVYMFVYSGPATQRVLDQWESMAFYQLLAQRGYVVVSIDTRGTYARGADFRKCTYEQLGKLESIDCIEAAKYLGGLPYVDKDRIGVMGWSFGGYLSTLCLTKGADYFKAAIAVAPVSNWRYYDNIYTERYMGLPDENPEGYDENSPINHLDKLKGNYLLIHGLADDNVHPQNSMDIINELVRLNTDFELMVYPNRDHSIWGQGARPDLYRRILTFVEAKL